MKKIGFFNNKLFSWESYSNFLGNLPNTNPFAHLLLIEAVEVAPDELLVGVLVAVGGEATLLAGVVAVLVLGRALIF